MSRSNISSNIMSRMAAFESTDSAAASRILPPAHTQATSDRSEEAVDLNGRTSTESVTTMMMSSPPPGVQTDANGLILPKKIINPCLESTDRKQLHRELKFNNKIGKSVLNQKTELQRAYERQREKQLQQHQLHSNEPLSPTANLKGELSRVIMERAQKHEQQQHQQQDDDDEKQYVNPEYLNVRAKLRTGQRADLK